MKAVFIGGGSLRLLGILRGALAAPGVFQDGVIHLHDLDLERAEALGWMLQKSPEFRRSNCRLSWGDNLDRALSGADLVGVILRAGSPLSFALGEQASLKRGFESSDNISLNGAFLALKGGPFILDLARRMEKYCPQALLLDFANPVAVLSGLVNNHTKIRALGVCAGYVNHRWDLTRLLYECDEEIDVFDLDVAGVNHLSYIVGGTVAGRDIFQAVDEALSNGWKMPRLQNYWQSWQKDIIRNSVRNLVRFYRELGVLVFSTEGDGMLHLDYEDFFRKQRRDWKPSGRAQILRTLSQRASAREEQDRNFRKWLSCDLDDKFWAEHWQSGDRVFRREDSDIFVRIMKAVAGCGRYKIAVSSPSHGQVSGFNPRHVLEYSQIIGKGGKITPAGKFSVPDVVQGLTAGIAAHQTLLGDAIAQDDPQILARALLSYPVRQYSKALRKLSRELTEINRDEIQPALRSVYQYL